MKLKDWAKRNRRPLIWYVLFTAINSAITGWFGLFGPWLITQAVLTLTFLLDVNILKKAVTLLLCGSLLALPYQAKAQEEGGDGGGAPAVVAAVVICAGGYCVYKIARFCQKHFPRNQSTTNSPPDALTSGDSDAASFNIGNLGSCAELHDPIPVTFAINGIVYPAVESEASRIACTVVASSGKVATLTWSEFAAEAQSYGVKVTGAGDGSQYFAHNGIPITAEESIIHYNAQTQTISVYSDPSKVHRVRIRRSHNLIYWQDFIELEVEENRNFQVLDTTVEGQMFYKMQIVEGD